MSARDLIRDVECLGKAEKQAILRIVCDAAIDRYLRKSSLPGGDVSVDLDKVRADMPAAYEEVLAVYRARMAALNERP